MRKCAPLGSPNAPATCRGRGYTMCHLFHEAMQDEAFVWIANSKPEGSRQTRLAMKGATFKSEATVLRDSRTGREVRQVTNHPSVHHHPFFYIPAYDDQMRWLFFVSHRAGAPQIFAEERSTGVLRQLTDRADLNEWSVHPAHRGDCVYFTAKAGAWRVHVESLKEELLADFGQTPMKEQGVVGAAMGTTTVSRDDRWWAVPVKVGSTSQFWVINLESGQRELILERDTIGHPQFHPDDAGLLHYAGPYHDRMWVINRDGTGNRLVYQRDAAKKEWIVHEVWMPGKRELLTVNSSPIRGKPDGFSFGSRRDFGVRLQT